MSEDIQITANNDWQIPLILHQPAITQQRPGQFLPEFLSFLSLFSISNVSPQKNTFSPNALIFNGTASAITLRSDPFPLNMPWPQSHSQHFLGKKRDFIKANMATPDILDIATNFKFVPLKQHRHAVEWHHNILFPLFGELLCDSSNRRIRFFLYKMIESHLAPYTSSQTQCGRIPQCRSYRHCTAPSLPPNGYPK